MRTLSIISFRLKYFLTELIEDESGVGTIELVLILVVLIALVAIFRDSIKSLLETILESVTSAAEAI